MLRYKVFAALTAAALLTASLPVTSGSALEQLDPSLFQNWLQGEKDLPNGYVMAKNTNDTGYVLSNAIPQTGASTDRTFYYYNSSDPLSKQLIYIDNYGINKISFHIPEYTAGEAENSAFHQFYNKYRPSMCVTSLHMTGGFSDKSYSADISNTLHLFHSEDERCSYANCVYFIQQWKNTPDAQLGTLGSAKYHFVDADATWVEYQGLQINSFLNNGLTQADVENALHTCAPGAALEVKGSTQSPQFHVTSIDFPASAAFLRSLQEKFPDLNYYCITEELSDSIKVQSEEKDLLNADPGFTFGDTNNDKEITLADAYNALMFSSREAIYGWTKMTDNSDIYRESQAFAAADVNLDGKIRLKDAYYILMYSSYQSIGTPKTWEEILNAD